MSLRSVNLNLSLIMIPSIPVLFLIPPSKQSVFRSRLPIFIPHLALKISRIPHSASILSPIPHPGKPMLDSHCFECLFASLVPLLCLLEVACTCDYILFYVSLWWKSCKMVPWTWFVKLCVWLELDMIMSNSLLNSSCKAKRLEQRNFFFQLR